MNFCEKNFDLDKMQFLFITFEIVQFCRHFGLPIAPVFPWFRMSCDVIKEHVTSGLTHLACFTSVNLA